MKIDTHLTSSVIATSEKLNPMNHIFEIESSSCHIVNEFAGKKELRVRKHLRKNNRIGDK